MGNSRVRALDNSSGCSRLQRHTHVRARSTKATRRRWPAPTYFPGLGVRHKSAQMLMGNKFCPLLTLNLAATGWNSGHHLPHGRSMNDEAYPLGGYAHKY